MTDDEFVMHTKMVLMDVDISRELILDVAKHTNHFWQTINTLCELYGRPSLYPRI